MSCDIRARIVPIETRGQINASFGGDVSCDNGTVNIVNTADTLLFSKTVPSGGVAEQVIPDTDYTDSDGTAKTQLAGLAIVCEPQVKDQSDSYPFPAGTDQIVATIIAPTDITYTANVLTNCSSPIYTKNAAVVMLPFAVSDGDTLQVNITQTDSGQASLVQLNGTYV